MMKSCPLKRNAPSVLAIFSSIVFLLNTPQFLFADAWTTAAPMGVKRGQHNATLLADGKVLVSGGYDNTSAIMYHNTAEVYDPVNNNWSPTGPMSSARYIHTSTRLNDGRVLVTGGTNGPAFLATAEIYNPATNNWTSVPSMSTVRIVHEAVLLNNGKVLVMGGETLSTFLSSVEIYDPVANNWTPAANMITARDRFSATLLANSKVLVVGGYNGSYLSNVEIYDPAINVWSPAAPLSHPRSSHAALLLSSGKVLVTGGDNGAGVFSDAEIFDPSTNMWSLAGSMLDGRQNPGLNLLSDGRALAEGGQGSGGSSLASADTYSSATNSWSATVPMSTARQLHKATSLADGRVLVTGGLDVVAKSISSVEIYTTNQPPVAICQNVVVNTTAGVCSAIASIDNGSNDPEGFPVNLLQTPAGPYPKGVTNVTLMVTDNQGASSSCSATVTVVDNQAPVLMCPASQVVNATSPSGVQTNFTPTVSDNCSGAIAVNCAPSSGSTFPIGLSSVSCTAQDTASNISSCNFSVTVEGAGDQIAALIALIQSLNLKPGLTNSLVVKLQSASDSLAAGHTNPACDKIDSFVHEADAQSGKGLSVAQANQLISAANQIKSVIGCV